MANPKTTITSSWQAAARLLLIEKYSFLGGAATNAQVLAYCGFFQQGPEPIKAVDGAADLALDALRELGLSCDPFRSPTTSNWIILLEQEAVKLALNRVLAAQGVEVLLHTRVAAVTRTADRIQSVTLAGMDGRSRVTAGAFIDATGDANLSLVAGIPFRTGNAEGKLQAISAPIRVGGRNTSVPIEREAIKTAFQTYQGRWPSARDDGGIYTEVPNTGELWWMMFDHPLVDFSSASFSQAERASREAAHDYVALLRNEVSGFEQAYLVSSGPQIGIR